MWPGRSHRAGWFDIPAWLDFELNPLIAIIHIACDDFEQGINVFLNADAHAHTDPLTHPTQHLLEALLASAPKPIPDGKFEARLGHAVGADWRKNPLDVGGVGDVLAHQHRRQNLVDHGHHGCRGFFVVPRQWANRRFAPTIDAIGMDAHDDGVTAFFAPATGFKRGYIGQINPAHFDMLNSHYRLLCLSHHSQKITTLRGASKYTANPAQPPAHNQRPGSRRQSLLRRSCVASCATPTDEFCRGYVT